MSSDTFLETSFTALCWIKQVIHDGTHSTNEIIQSLQCCVTDNALRHILELGVKHYNEEQLQSLFKHQHVSNNTNNTSGSHKSGPIINAISNQFLKDFQPFSNSKPSKNGNTITDEPMFDVFNIEALTCKIFQFLDFQSIIQCCKVNKQFMRDGLNPQCTTTIHMKNEQIENIFQDFNNDITGVLRCLTRMKYVECLTLEINDSLNAEYITFLTQYFKHESFNKLYNLQLIYDGGNEYEQRNWLKLNELLQCLIAVNSANLHQLIMKPHTYFSGNLDLMDNKNENRYFNFNLLKKCWIEKRTFIINAKNLKFLEISRCSFGVIRSQLDRLIKLLSLIDTLETLKFFGCGFPEANEWNDINTQTLISLSNSLCSVSNIEIINVRSNNLLPIITLFKLRCLDMLNNSKDCSTNTSNEINLESLILGDLSDRQIDSLDIDIDINPDDTMKQLFDSVESFGSHYHMIISQLKHVSFVFDTLPAAISSMKKLWDMFSAAGDITTKTKTDSNNIIEDSYWDNIFDDDTHDDEAQIYISSVNRIRGKICEIEQLSLHQPLLDFDIMKFLLNIHFKQLKKFHMCEFFCDSKNLLKFVEMLDQFMVEYQNNGCIYEWKVVVYVYDESHIALLFNHLKCWQKKQFKMRMSVVFTYPYRYDCKKDICCALNKIWSRKPYISIEDTTVQYEDMPREESYRSCHYKFCAWPQPHYDRFYLYDATDNVYLILAWV